MKAARTLGISHGDLSFSSVTCDNPKASNPMSPALVGAAFAYALAPWKEIFDSASVQTFRVLDSLATRVKMSAISLALNRVELSRWSSLLVLLPASNNRV
jgi:hypothetical protein